MREFLGGLLALVSLGAMGISLIAIIRPLPKLNLPTRRKAALAFAASFALMIVAGAILPTRPPSEAQTTSTSAREPPPSKPASKIDLTADTKAMWDEILVAVAPCDAASKLVASASDRSGDVYEVYEVVKEAESRCTVSWQALNDLDPPRSAKGQAKKHLAEAISTCSTAYWMKKEAYEKMAKVLDGDMRPSAVTTAKSSMEDATGAQLACVAGLMGAAEKAGVPMSALSEGSGKSE